MKKTNLIITALLILITTLGFALYYANETPDSPPTQERPSPRELPEIETPLEIVQPKFGQARMFGIDRHTLLLTDYTNPQEPQAVYPKPIEGYTYQHPLVLIIPTSSNGRVVTINLDSNQTQTIDLQAFVPIDAISLSPDASTVYFIGKRDNRTRTSTLFSSPTTKIQPIPVSTNSYTSVQALNNSVLALAEADGSDLSRLYIIDAISGTTSDGITFNRYSVSPAETHLNLITSTTTSIVNLPSGQKLAEFNGSYIDSIWTSENNLHLFTNRLEGAYFQTVDLTHLTPSAARPIPSLQGKLILSILGTQSNRFYIYNHLGFIDSISLEELMP
jgi:hypothetical protein